MWHQRGQASDPGLEGQMDSPEGEAETNVDNTYPVRGGGQGVTDWAPGGSEHAWARVQSTSGQSALSREPPAPHDRELRFHHKGSKANGGGLCITKVD